MTTPPPDSAQESEPYQRKCMGCLREPPAGHRNLGRRCLRELVNGLRRRREAERRLQPLADFYPTSRGDSW